jgi:16S rRNA (cytosine967-C5)-methyltransferase
MLAGEVVAVEVNEARARQLEANLRRMGSTARIVVADGRELPAELRDFDRALVDAPCSGLGVLARRADLRWRAEPLPQLQAELLRAALERVRAGGSVVYSVCTPNSDEGRVIVDAVVEAGLATVDESLGDEWPAFRDPERPGHLLMLPHVHGTSGFFVARLRRR